MLRAGDLGQGVSLQREHEALLLAYTGDPGGALGKRAQHPLAGHQVKAQGHFMNSLVFFCALTWQCKELWFVRTDWSFNSHENDFTIVI